MAETLTNGTVIPSAGDPISAAGVQEVRTLGVSVDSELGRLHAGVDDAQGAAQEAKDAAAEAAWHKGTLATGSDLNALDMPNESGVYYLSPNNTYLNGPWNLSGNRATIRVEATGFSGTQTISIYQSPTVWRRDMNNSNARPRGWTDWKRVDVTVDQLTAIESSLAGVMNWNGTIPEGTNFNDLRWQSTNGIHQIHGSYPYVNEPPGRTGPGMLVSFSTSNGETWHRAIWRGGGVTERYQLTSNGQFSEWTEPGNGGGGSGGDAGNEAEALAYMQPLTTAFEVTQRFTPYEAIDGFVGLLGKRYPSRLEVMDVGTGFSGRRIRTIRLGDPTKPTLHLMAAQHGNEPMGKEATLALARRLAEDPTLEAFLTEACILITPVVNVDRINETRQNGSGTNLNRNWQTKTTREVQAMAALMDSHDVVLAADLHEGGANGVTMTDPPSHEDVAPSLVAQSEALIAELATALADTEYPQADWPSTGNPETFVNGAALEWKCATVLIEARSNLGAGNIYWPPVTGRFEVYNLIVDTIVQHFRDHLPDYVAAKAAAQA